MGKGTWPNTVGGLWNMRRTKTVCTIGPASEKRLPEMIEAGMNVARFNFSHGDYEEHGARIPEIRRAAKVANKIVAILLDTKGPEIRTHTFEEGKALLVRGQEVIVDSGDANELVGLKDKFSVTYEGLYDDVEVGSMIMLDDGLIGLRVVKKLPNRELPCSIGNEGVIKTKKCVNLPNVKVNLPALTDKDVADIEFGIKSDGDLIAPSFVRRASDVVAIRQLLEKNNATHIKIFPKIEN
jgi:pyruvate kinase